MVDLLKTKDCMTGMDANRCEEIAVAGAAYLLVQGGGCSVWGSS